MAKSPETHPARFETYDLAREIKARLAAIESSTREIEHACHKSDEDRTDCRDSLATLNEQLKAVQGLRGFVILD